MLPMRFFRSRTFSAANVASLAMFFGMFGSIFLLTQFLQTVQGYSPLQARACGCCRGRRCRCFVAPIAGAMSDRIGGRPLMATGLALQAVALGWLAAIMTPTVAYVQLVAPFIIAGVGMALFFAPGRERRPLVGEAGGGGPGLGREQRDPRARRRVRRRRARLDLLALRRLPDRGQTFVDGLTPAVWVGAAFVAVGAVAALFIQRKRQPEAIGEAFREAPHAVAEVAFETALTSLTAPLAGLEGRGSLRLVQASARPRSR